MPTAHEELRGILAEAQEFAAKGALDKEQRVTFAAIIARGEELKDQIQQESKLSDLAGWAGKSAGAPPMAAPSNGKASVVGITEAGKTTVERDPHGLKLAEQYGEGIFDAGYLAKTGTKEYRDAFKTYLRSKGQVVGDGLKVLQEASDSSGGFLVPSDILDRVISREPTPTRVAGLVTQLQTSRDNLIIPKVVYNADDLYTTGMRVTWTGEVPAAATTARVTDPVFGQVSVPVFTAMMSLPITNDMIEDANFPLVSYAAGKFGETIDLLRDNMILNGTGQAQPAGILVNPGAANQPSVIVSGSASALTADGLINTAFALPEQYDDNAVFIFNKTSTGAAIAELKDSNNRYLWGSGLQDSGLVPSIRDRRLLGYPCILSGFMPNVAASAYPVIFGDPRGYYLVNRIGFSVQVLRELYAETNQVLLLGRIRFGGLVAEPWKIKLNQAHA